VDDRYFVPEALRSDLPVLLDVRSPGCGACGVLEPIIVSLAGTFQGQVKVAEMNAGEAGATAARLGVMGTPTVLFFKGRREVGRVVGLVGQRCLREVIQSQLLETGAANGAGS